MVATMGAVAKETGGGSGKWRQRGVPHKGWTHVDTEDLDEPSETCEMCEAVEIRYVHIMEHPDYDGPLRVGCVCAENMSGDKVGPKRRERELANAASRRRKWLTRVYLALGYGCHNRRNRRIAGRVRGRPGQLIRGGNVPTWSACPES